LRAAGEVMKALDDASAEIQRVSTKLSRLSVEMYEGKISADGEVEMGIALRYEEALDDALIAIYTDAMEGERKMPAEGIREAIARKAVKTKDLPLFLDYRNKLQEIEAMKVWITSQKAAISANQSVLRGERE